MNGATFQELELKQVEDQITVPPVKESPSNSSWWDNCPTDIDTNSDSIVVSTRRRILRLAYVAARVGAWFGKENIDVDPVAWLAAPRQAFEGSCALEACQELRGFQRAIALTACKSFDECPIDLDDALELDPLDSDDDTTQRTSNSPLLYTAIIVERAGADIRHVFYGVVAAEPAIAARRLLNRLDGRVAGLVSLQAGFDHTLPVAAAMVSDALACILRQIDEYPCSPLAAGFDVFLEQRFSS